MAIAWRDVMAIDHGEIDDDHRQLIGMVNGFSAAKTGLDDLGELNAMLDKLGHYTQTHFAREEALQRSIRYPFADAHQRQHKDLIAQLGAMRAQLRTALEGAPNEHAAQMVLTATHSKLVTFLGHWLIEHILKSDLEMKPFIEKSRAAAG